jgi:DNA-binding transcriptional MocR family regulator
LRPATSGGTQAARDISATFLARKDWSPSADQVVFTANGRQCIAAALAAIVPTGGRCGVEAMTYPFIKGIAARLGVTLVPLAMDEHGVRPDAVQKAHCEAHLSALYLQPVIQNPLGMTMSSARRADLLRVVKKLDLAIIEDAVYSFLVDEAPLAALAPDLCILATACRNGLRRGSRSVSSSLRSACARASWPPSDLEDGPLQATRSPPGSG